MYRYFFGAVDYAAFLARCISTFSWFVPLRERLLRFSVESTAYVITFRLSVRAFSVEHTP